MSALFLLVAISEILVGFIGAWIGGMKKMAGVGFLLGLLLGPIGLIIIALLQPSQIQRDSMARDAGMRRCPHCGEFVRPEAAVCRFCQRDLARVDPTDEAAVDRAWEGFNPEDG